MGFPKTSGKHAYPAVIEPAQVIEERKKEGLHPTGPVADGAILCYDAALWQWVGTLPGRVACDGWLEGAYLLPHADRWILAMKVAGWGAPTAVMALEELIASGVPRFVSVGAAGGLQETLSVGDVVVCDRAIRDEGTSHHYLPDARYASACPDLTTAICSAMREHSIPIRVAASWTTDAPYRETIDELRSYRSAGVATVEMEAAALFAVGSYRGVSVSSAFVISDVLAEDGWTQRYHGEAKIDGLKGIFSAVLPAIATPTATRKEGHPGHAAKSSGGREP